MVENLFQAERLYVALIASLRGSRRRKPEGGSESLEDLLAELNRRHSGVLAARFAIPVGDEIHALFRAPDSRVAAAVVQAVGEVSEGVAPRKVSFGLGLGGLETELHLEAIGMAGACFDRARSGLERARKGDRWVVARGFGEARDHALSAIFILLGALRSGWTRKQAAYARAARTRLQKEVARESGVRPSVVCESLRAARFEEVRIGEGAAERLIAQAGTGFGGLFRERWRATRRGGA